MVCGRTSLNAASRSHSNIKTLRKQHLNMQSKWIAGMRVALCTKCIKTAKTKELLPVGTA